MKDAVAAFFKACPTPTSVLYADQGELRKTLLPLGLNRWMFAPALSLRSSFSVLSRLVTRAPRRTCHALSLQTRPHILAGYGLVFLKPFFFFHGQLGSEVVFASGNAIKETHIHTHEDARLASLGVGFGV